MEPDSPKGAGKGGRGPESSLFVTTACPLLSSGDCNNLPGWVNAHRACGDDRVTTAVPSPTSATQQTEHALLGAGEQQTSEVGYLLVDPEGNGHQIQGVGAFHVREVVVPTKDWGCYQEGMGSVPSEVHLPVGQPVDVQDLLNLDVMGPADGDGGVNVCASVGGDEA